MAYQETGLYHWTYIAISRVRHSVIQMASLWVRVGDEVDGGVDGDSGSVM